MRTFCQEGQIFKRCEADQRPHRAGVSFRQGPLSMVASDEGGPLPWFHVQYGPGDVQQVWPPATAVKVDQRESLTVTDQISAVKIAVDQAKPARKALPLRRLGHDLSQTCLKDGAVFSRWLIWSQGGL